MYKKLKFQMKEVWYTKFICQTQCLMTKLKNIANAQLFYSRGIISTG